MRGACLCGGVRFELTERPGRLIFPGRLILVHRITSQIV